MKYAWMKRMKKKKLNEKRFKQNKKKPLNSNSEGFQFDLKAF